MEELLQWELAWIAWLQSAGLWLAGAMQQVSRLGNEEFYLVLMPVLYWSVDAVLGARMAAMLLLSNGLNSAFKLLFHSPRPYWIDPQIRALSAETSFGIPSGHAMNAASIWGFLLTRLRQSGWRLALLVLILLIGFSRILLGMHFVSDVVAGWVLGALLLLLYLRLEQPVLRWAKRMNLGGQVLLALLSALGLGGLVLLAATALNNWQIPAQWLENSLAAVPEEPIDPTSLDGAFTTAGTWFGMFAGISWLFHRQGGYHAGGTLTQRVLRCLVGLVGVVFFWYGLGAIFPREADLLSYALRFVRYSLLGLWVSALAPLLFRRLRLSDS